MHAAKDHYSLSEMQIHTNSIKCRRIANPAERAGVCTSCPVIQRRKATSVRQILIE